jgi:hypothetical protein
VEIKKTHNRKIAAVAPDLALGASERAIIALTIEYL